MFYKTQTIPGTPEGEAMLFALALQEYAGKRLNGAISGIEIGCLNGDSAHTILSAHERVGLISIDPFIPDSMEASLIGSLEAAKARNQDFIQEGRYGIIPDYSENVHEQFDNEAYDFLFIDGDHTPEGVARDYELYVPKLKQGGLLFMHDARMYCGGAKFHPGPSELYMSKVRNKPGWHVIGEAWSLICAVKLERI